MSDALLHSDRNQIALVFLLDHLLEPADMHGVENAFYDWDLARWLHIHRLLHAHADPFILCRVYAINTKRVRLSVIEEGLDLKCAIYCFLLYLGEARGLLLYFTVAGACDQVADRE